MIRTSIQQIYGQDEGSRQPLDRREQSTLVSLEKAFASMLDQAARTEVVIDALDESCQQRDTIEWLWQISAGSIIAPNKLKVIIKSRQEHDIESAFLSWLPKENVSHIRADVVDQDTSSFVHSQIRMSPRLERWRQHPDVQEEIESKLTGKAHGMFRWVTCQLNTLKNCLDLVDLREALNNLPIGLDETYTRILAKVDTINRKKAIAMLQLLVWAETLLQLDQLVDALAIRRDEDGFHYDPRNRMPVSKEVVKILPGLVIVDIDPIYTQPYVRLDNCMLLQDSKIVELFLDYGADPNAYDDHGNTFVIFAHKM